MFDQVLRRMRAKIAAGEYVMTAHAEEEMEDDGLSIFDIEHAVLDGAIVERQREAGTNEYKYRLEGPTIGGKDMVVVLKMGPTGKVVMITVFLLTK